MRDSQQLAELWVRAGGTLALSGPRAVATSAAGYKHQPAPGTQIEFIRFKWTWPPGQQSWAVEPGQACGAGWKEREPGSVEGRLPSQEEGARHRSSAKALAPCSLRPHPHHHSCPPSVPQSPVSITSPSMSTWSPAFILHAQLPRAASPRPCPTPRQNYLLPFLPSQAHFYTDTVQLENASWAVLI